MAVNISIIYLTPVSKVDAECSCGQPISLYQCVKKHYIGEPYKCATCVSKGCHLTANLCKACIPANKEVFHEEAAYGIFHYYYEGDSKDFNLPLE
jgi:hypothetical protein